MKQASKQKLESLRADVKHAWQTLCVIYDDEHKVYNQETGFGENLSAGEETRRFLDRIDEASMLLTDALSLMEKAQEAT